MADENTTWGDSLNPQWKDPVNPQWKWEEKTITYTQPWIQFNRENGGRVLVNFDGVNYINYLNDELTSIHTDDGSMIVVQRSFEEIVDYLTKENE